MSNTTPQSTDTKSKPVKTVEVIVNNKKVEVLKRTSGAEIKKAAHVPADFHLFRIAGKKEIPVSDDEPLTVHADEQFTASPTLDPSFNTHPLTGAAAETVRDAFADRVVDVDEPGDGSAVVTVREVPIGANWFPPTIDLSVKLQVTFPTTPPYPFYGPAGMTRTDGLSLAQIQPHVLVDGAFMTQISLNKPFDPAVETLGSRFAAVVRWLRNPA